jgi:dihydroorotate dehydrogenase
MFAILLYVIRHYFIVFCRRVYTSIAKPLFFMTSPDKAHSTMISVVSYTGRFALFRAPLRFLFNNKNLPILAQTIHGVDIKSPIGLSAGFDKNGEIIPMIAQLGFGFETVGSVTAYQCDGNPRPWFYRLPKTKSIVVNAGLANHGSKEIIKRIHDYGKNTIGDFPVVLSVAKTNSCKVVDTQTGIDDYVVSIKRAKREPRIKMIEINISCPNTYGGEPFTSPAKLNRLLKAIDAIKVKQPVYVKMPVDLSWDDFKALLDVIIKHKVAGVTIANLAKDRSKIELKDELPDSVKGNLSGRPTWHMGNELIRQTYINYGDRLTIIGAGGVFSASDAYRKIRLGASLVDIITGVIFCGPQLAAEIRDDLAILLERDGFNNISDAVGVDAYKG